MRAITTCPKCKEIIEEDCEACITSGLLEHTCKGNSEFKIYDVKWEIIEK